VGWALEKRRHGGAATGDRCYVALKDLVAISNGSACTSSSYTPSHVIKAMGYGDDEANEAIRMSWCHLTPEVEWDELVERVRGLR